MPISHEHKCIFIHIPKTGGTSIENALGVFGDWKEQNTCTMFGKINSEELRRLSHPSNFLQHITASTLKKIDRISFDDYYKFSFVRNPWDRFVSSYSNKDPDLVDRAENQGIKLSDATFEEYVYLTENIKHPHLSSQFEYLFGEDGECIVDFIGRFEKIEEDFELVREKIGISASLEHLNSSSHKPYREYYNRKTKLIIKNRYLNDINIFKYKF